MQFNRNKVIKYFILCSAFPLMSCAYSVEKAYQDINFVTPGAEYAQCDVYVDKLRYVVLPPQTLGIMKSDSDMKIHCVAPGNRTQDIIVPSKFAGRTLWGTPAGMAWDYASSSMFSYPSVIAIDFSQEITKPNAVPRHNNPDIVQPEDYDLEEYLPGVPRLNSDRKKHVDPVKRREEIIEEEAQIPDTPIEEPPQTVPDKGNLEQVIQNLKPSPKQQVPPVISKESKVTPLPLDTPALEDQNTSTPVKLYPGE